MSVWMRLPKVLAVTRRPKNLCAASDMLNAAGFSVVAATNLETALTVARAVRFDAAFVCYHSFTPAQRESIAAELNKANPQLAVIGRCPGCVGCDETAGIIGKLENSDAVSVLISALR